jgi:hypothetical protein
VARDLQGNTIDFCDGEFVRRQLPADAPSGENLR